MKIGERDVEKIASLARLSITEEEKALFGGQLSNILEHVEALNAVDTSNVEPTSHVLDLYNVMREDSNRPSLDIDSALSNAPDRSNGFYRVPKIIESA